METCNFHVPMNVIFISHLTSYHSWEVCRAGVTWFYGVQLRAER